MINEMLTRTDERFVPRTARDHEIVSMQSALSVNASSCGNKTAYRAKVRGLWRSWSWAEVESETIEIQSILAHAGIRPGMKVALSGEAEPRLYWYIFAIQRLGAVPILLNSRMSARELAELYQKAEFTVLIAGSEAQVEVATRARNACSKLRMVISLDRGPAISDSNGFVVREAYLARLGSNRSDPPKITPQDNRAVIISTYDERGQAILVTWSHSSVAAAAGKFIALAHIHPSDEFVSFLPISWSGEFSQFIAALFSAAVLSAVENSSTVFRDLQQLAPSVIVAPVSFYRKLLVKIESDVWHSSRVASRLYQWSNALASSSERVDPNEPSAPGLFDRICLWALNGVFRAPLRNVIGFSKVRLAFCAEAILPPELRRRLKSLDIDVRPLRFDLRFGGVLSCVAPSSAGRAPIVIRAAGVELRNSSAGEALCRTETAALGIAENGGQIVPIRSRLDGWYHTFPFEEIDQNGDLTSVEDIDLGELHPSVASSLRAHVARLNSSLLIKHSILRHDGGGGWVAVINPDPDSIRAISEDPGVGYRDIIEQKAVIDALAEVVAQSNIHERRVSQSPAIISSFACFAQPLSAEDGSLTRDGRLRYHDMRNIVPIECFQGGMQTISIARLHAVAAV
jgi:long-chain acyl-CoA synthetase